MFEYQFGLMGVYIRPAGDQTLQPESLLLVESLEQTFQWAVLECDDRFWWFAPTEDIDALPPINELKVECKYPDGAKAPIDATSIFEPFNVDTFELAWKRIASTARPIKDPWQVRLVCKRAVKLMPKEFEILGLCLCPVGYRILDAELDQDPDLIWFQKHSQQLFNWMPVVKPASFARWTTSVLMVEAYLHLSHGNFLKAEPVLHRLLEFKGMIPYAALIQTNLVRSCFILVDHYLDSKELKMAELLLKKLIEVTADGIRYSEFTALPSGHVKFSEVEVTIRGARDAHKLLAAIRKNASLEELKRSYNLMELGGYTYILEKRKQLRLAVPTA